MMFDLTMRFSPSELGAILPSSNNYVGKIDGKIAPNSEGENRMVRSNIIGPDFFHTLDVPVLAGREFTDADTAASPRVAIINELFAKRFLPNENPLGHHIGWSDPKDDVVIVGVVKNHKYRSIEEAPIPMMWTTYTQQTYIGEMHVEMRV